MKRKIIIFILVFLPSILFAQSNEKQTATTFPQNGKYEIITSSLAFRYTFLLNRETGDTWQLVTTRSGGSAWEKIYRNRNSDDKVPDGYKGAVYQITMSGMAAKGMWLTNTLTGATWTLYSDSDTGELFWGVIGSPE